MKLSDVINQLQSGDIIARRTTTFFSNIIRRWTGETWAHCGVIWIDTQGVAWIFQSFPGIGVECVPLASMLPFDWIHIGRPLSPAALALAQSQVGKPYGWIDLALVSIGLHPRQNGLICSEYAARILATNGALDSTVAFGAVTPGMLVEWLLDAGAPLKSIEFN